MTLLKKQAWLAVVSILVIVVSMLIIQQILAHGSIETPISRVYNCYLEGPENPQTAACQAVVDEGGTQPLYDWNAVSRLAGGNHQDIIPDGELCSAGNHKYRGLDLARDDWPTQTITADANGNYEFVYYATAPHSTDYFEFYVTKEDYDPLQPLKWSDLEDEPFCRNTDVALVNGRYHMTCPLPQNKSGKHVIYNIWQRDDSDEAFYACSDVIFGDGPAPTSTVTATNSPPTTTATSTPVTVTNTPISPPGTATATSTSTPVTATNTPISPPMTSTPVTVTNTPISPPMTSTPGPEDHRTFLAVLLKEYP